MREWTKILIHPLGLAGFVLFLVFGLFAKLKQRDERRWLFRSAIVMALIALLGGLTLAYVRVQAASVVMLSKPQPGPAPDPPQQQINEVHQISNGTGSPNVQGVQGDVTITVDQSSGHATRQNPKLTQEKRRTQTKAK